MFYSQCFEFQVRQCVWVNGHDAVSAEVPAKGCKYRLDTATATVGFDENPSLAVRVNVHVDSQIL